MLASRRPGIVQVFASRSISSHIAPRTSHSRFAVSAVNRIASFTASELFDSSILASAPATSRTGRNSAWVAGGTSIWRFGPLAGFAFSRCPLSIEIDDRRIRYQLAKEHEYDWTDPEEWVRAATISMRCGTSRRLLARNKKPEASALAASGLPKLLSVDGQSGLLCEQPPEVALDARKPNRCVLGCRSCGARVRIPRSSPPASSAPVPTRCGTGGPAVRRTGPGPARQLPRTRQRGPLCRDPSRLQGRGILRLPATPAFVPRAPAGPLQRANARLPAPGAHFVALLVHLPGRCTTRGGDPRCRRWSGVSAQRGRFRPQRLLGQSFKATAPYHRVTKASLAACLAGALPHKARTPPPPPVTTPPRHAP